MKNSNFKKKFENLSIPQHDGMKEHYISLRRELLTSPHWDNPTATWYHQILLFLKGGENIQMKKMFMSLSVVMAVLVLIGILTINGRMPTQSVNAQEVVKAAYEKGVSLSPEEKAKIEKNIDADLITVLNEAMSASNLRIITPEEFYKEQKDNTGIGGITIRLGNGQSNPLKLEGEGIKVLRYTNAEGNIVFLAIDKDDNVAMMFIKIPEANMQVPPPNSSGEALPVTQGASGQANSVQDVSDSIR